MPTNSQLLSQVAAFIKVAVDTNEELEGTLLELRKKQAAEALDQDRYELALKKAADVLYDSDFLTDEREKRTFIRKAAEDPSYVVRMLENVCQASDISQLGKVAKVSARPKEAAFDPVMARAFPGMYGNTPFTED